MNHTITLFDHYDNHDIHEFRLTNSNGVSISCLDQGALWYTFLVPDENHNSKNIILNFPKMKDYYENPFYIGMAIGRTAGRIKNGKVTINSKVYQLSQNEGNNTLHGGLNGFNSLLWTGKIENNKIIFNLQIPNLSDSFPANLDVTLIYELTEKNEVSLTFTGLSDQDTFFNPTSHVYFNLNDSDATMLNHSLYVSSKKKLELDKEKLPTNRLDDLAHTPFDFSEPTTLKNAIDDLQNITEKGIDDVYYIDEHSSDEPIATLSSPETNRKISIYSKRNGLVIFTGNSIPNNLPFAQRISQPYLGIALESQTLPNAVSDRQFGDISLSSNKPKSYKISYQLTY